jgi:archaetidylinositol phosphate synthase
VLHWVGGSLDGTLARVRKSERPRYGYYLNHLVDAFATAAVGIGLGLSPHMLLAVGLAIVVVYLILSINTYLETHAFGVFTVGNGRFGPTEARLGLIGVNTLLALGIVGSGLLDVLGIGLAAAMIVAVIARAGRNLKPKTCRAQPSMVVVSPPRGYAGFGLGSPATPTRAPR